MVLVANARLNPGTGIGLFVSIFQYLKLIFSHNFRVRSLISHRFTKKCIHLRSIAAAMGGEQKWGDDGKGLSCRKDVGANVSQISFVAAAETSSGGSL